MTRLLFHSGSVLDVVSGEVRTADVVLDGDRITGVGIGLDGDDGIDCSGGLLVPGFIDCHTHVCITQTRLDPYGLPRSVRPLSAVPVLKTLLSLGVTTVRDAWGADAGVRMAVEKGWIDGPQVRRCRIRSSTARTGREPSYGGWSEPAFGGSSTTELTLTPCQTIDRPHDDNGSGDCGQDSRWWGHLPGGDRATAH